MKQRFVRRWGPLAAAGVLLPGLLSGCGLSNPGDAATVGDESIPVTQVDDITRGVCSIVSQAVATGQGQPLVLAEQKQQVLSTLVQAELGQQFARDRGVTPSPEVVQLFATNFKAPFAAFDGSGRDDVESLFDELALGRAGAVAVAAQETGQEPSPDNLDQLAQQGLQLQDEWARGVDVETDPRYGLGADLAPSAGDGSVSEPVTQLARQTVQAASGESDPTLAASLPPGQRCGG